MVEKLAVVTGGHRQYFSYDEIQRDGKYDQTLFRQWKRTNSTLHCTCNPLGPVIMLLPKRPYSTSEFYLRTKQKQEYSHVPSCCRYAEEDGSDRPTQVRLPSVEHSVTQDGKPIVVVHMNELFELDSLDAASLDILPDTAVEVNPQKRNSRSPEFRVTREKASIGALLREWYTIAVSTAAQRKFALDHTVLLRSMQKTLLSEQIVVHGTDTAVSKMVLIPAAKLRVRFNEHKVLVGFTKEHISDNDDGSQTWYLHGLDNVKWKVNIQQQHLPPHRLDENRLCMIRIKNVLNEFVTTHRIFDVIIHPDGAVWLDSTYESEVFSLLKSELGFTVIKPLLPMDDFFGYKPDFILPETRPKTVIEVWGMSESNKEYHQHRREKQAFYRAMHSRGLIRFVEWNVHEELSGLERLRRELSPLRSANN